MPRDGRPAATAVAVLVIAVLALVHAGGGMSDAMAQKSKPKSTANSPAAAASPPKVHYGTAGLPPPVLEMRDAILSAVRSGRIKDLRTAVELNEIKPVVGDKPVGDLIAHWRQRSGDGEGREVLALLGEILDAGYVVLPIGRDLENNRVYVWPYFAELAPDKLTPAQEVELLRLVPAETLGEMKRQGRYTHYKLGIGADGTWHFFLR
jgi:hypothetical protein